MIEQPKEDSIQNSGSASRSDIPWIFRFSLVLAVTCGVVGIFAVAFKFNSAVKADVTSQGAIAPTILSLPTNKYIPPIQSVPQNPVITKPHLMRSATGNQSRTLTQPQISNPISPAAKIPDAQVSTTPPTITPAPQNPLAQPKEEVVIISQNPTEAEKIPESTLETVPKPIVQQESVPDEPSVELTLSEVVFLGLENNRDIKNQYLERIAQKQDLAVAEGKFVPNFTPQLSVSALRLGSGQRVAIGEVDLSARVSVKVPTGGEIRFSWQTQRQDGNSFGINSENSLSQNLQLSFNQPILRGGGVAVNRASVEIGRLNEKRNFLSLKSTLIDTITLAILAYRDLIKAQEQVKIAGSSLEIARRQLEINQALIEAGKRARVEIFASEKAVADQEVSVLETENQLKKARLALLQILDLDRNLNITATEAAAIEAKPLDFNKIIQLALSSRPDYLQAQLEREIAKYNLLVAENNRKWGLDVNASYNNNASNSANGSSDLRAGLVVSREFGNRGIERDFQRSRVNLLQAENKLKELNQTLEVDVTNAIREINLKLRQVELAQRSRELAEKQLEIEQDKLKLGLPNIRIIDIVNFQDALVRAKNVELEARIAYFNALTNLDKIIGTTLETWQVRIENE